MLDDEGQQIGLLELLCLARFGGLGHLADHGQHRPFDRAPNCAIGRIAGRAKRTCDHPFVDRVALAEYIGEAPHDLAEDDAGVATRAHQRGAGQFAGNRFVPLRGRLLERFDDRPHGESQIRARVTVGNGIDVEVVDPLPVRLEIRE